MFTLRLNKLIFVPTIIICLLTFLSMLNKSIITKGFQVKKKHVIFSGLLGMYQRKKSMRPYCVSMLTLLQLYICCGCFLVLLLLSNWSVYPAEILPLPSGRGERGKREREHPVQENCRWTVEFHSFQSVFRPYCICFDTVETNVVRWSWCGLDMYSIKKTCSLISLWWTQGAEGPIRFLDLLNYTTTTNNNNIVSEPWRAPWRLVLSSCKTNFTNIMHSMCAGSGGWSVEPSQHIDLLILSQILYICMSIYVVWYSPMCKLSWEFLMQNDT